ncbi:MAG TPA: TadE family protein [Egibacteraceae bacterium]|nr:TadE family protein [Egibacteraceae bacterium]
MGLDLRAGERTPSDSGAMTVEFGIMFPVLILLVSGAVFFGLALHTQITLTGAAREGVRVYALGGGDPVSITQNAAPTLAGVAVTTSGNCNPASPGDPPPQAWVNASHDLNLNLPFLPLSTVTLNGRAVMRCGG